MRIAIMTLALATLCLGCTTIQQDATTSSNVEQSGYTRGDNLRAYAESAKTELAHSHCDQDFKFVKFADIQEVYQATCADGHVQFVQCDETTCRLTK